MSSQSIKTITSIGIAAIAINGLIGAGIFALPAPAANQIGLFSPWMFILCGLAIMPIVACFSFLSSGFDNTGGPIVYSTKAFGPFVGFQTGWLLYLGRVSALAANGHALVLYLSLYFPALAQSELASIAVCGLITVLALINLVGVKNAMWSIYAVTFLKLSPLVLFVLLGSVYFDPILLANAPTPIMSDIPTSMLLLIYAYIGFEGALVPASEAQNPKKDMPKAIMVTLVAAIILYFFIQSIVVTTLTTPIEGRTPLVDSAEIIGQRFGLTWLGLALALAAIISIFGNLLALMLAAPRMTQAMAEQKQLPNWFAQQHNRFLTPAYSIYFLSGFAMILAITKGFVWLAIFSSLARLIGYLICVLALPKLHASNYVSGNKWIVWLVAAIAAIVCLWLMAQASLQAWAFCGGFVFLGAVLFVLSRRAENLTEN